MDKYKSNTKDSLSWQDRMMLTPKYKAKKTVFHTNGPSKVSVGENGSIKHHTKEAKNG